MNVQHAGRDRRGTGVGVASRERRNRASPRLRQPYRTRQTRRGEARAVRREPAGAGERASAGDRAAGERHGTNRIGKGGKVEHSAIDRHATGAQSIADAVTERAAADRRQAGVGVRCRERQQAAAIFGQRAGARADRAADRRVASPSHRQAKARSGDRAGVQCQQVGVGIDSCRRSKRHRASPGVVAADVAQGAVIAHSRTAQRQRFASHRDPALQLQRRRITHGRGTPGRAEGVVVLNVEHAGSDPCRAAVAVAAGERCDRASARLIERTGARQAHRRQPVAGHRIAAAGGQRRTARAGRNRAVAERDVPHRDIEAIEIEPGQTDQTRAAYNQRPAIPQRLGIPHLQRAVAVGIPADRGCAGVGVGTSQKNRASVGHRQVARSADHSQEILLAIGKHADRSAIGTEHDVVVEGDRRVFQQSAAVENDGV